MLEDAIEGDRHWLSNAPLDRIGALDSKPITHRHINIEIDMA